MKKVITFVVIVFVAAVAHYHLWSAFGRSAVAAEPSLYLEDTSSYGVDSGNGNLVGVQTYMEAEDYASAEAYRAKLDGYMAQANTQGWLQSDTVVVFPEWMGTWLVLANEKKELYQTETLEEAMQLMVLSNLPSFVQSYSKAQGEDRIRDALFRMKADTIADIHADTFSTLAKKYGVTIVSGSLILPDAQVENGELVLGSGVLQNVSLVYQPDGTLHPDLVRKIVLMNDEALFTGAGTAKELPTFTTPAGKVAVLICADSWYPANYDPLKAQDPQMIVVPNNFISDVGWDEIFQGWNPGPPPADVDLTDIGRITEGEARLKYTLDGRMQDTGASTGLHVFFRGNIWDLTSQGHTIIFTEDGVIEAPPEARGAIVNYWLPEKREL